MSIESEISAPAEKAIPFLLEWRERLGVSPFVAARLIGITEREYMSYESGTRDIPLRLLRCCTAVERDKPLPPFSLPRDRWVDFTELAYAYRRGEPVVANLVRAEQWETLRDFVRFMKAGPDPDLAMTDPVLFRVISEAAIKAHLEGVTHFDIPFDEVNLDLTAAPVVEIEDPEPDAPSPDRLSFLPRPM